MKEEKQDDLHEVTIQELANDLKETKQVFESIERKINPTKGDQLKAIVHKSAETWDDYLKRNL